MTRNRDLGISEHTPLKNAHYSGLLGMHMTMVKNKLTRECPYQLFDLNAGPGRISIAAPQRSLWDSPDAPPSMELTGSPLLALACASQRAIPYRAVFFEKDPEFRACLKANLPKCDGITVAGDHSGALDYLCNCAKCYRIAQGLIYSDESGHIPPFELLGQLTTPQRMKVVDCLIYYSATAHKRARGRFGGSKLSDYLACIPKRYWLIREPKGRFQWTFLIGTNWEKYPVWHGQGFHRLGSPEGMAVMRRLNLTADELRAEDEETDAPISQLPGIPETPDVSGYPCRGDAPSKRYLREVPYAAG